MATDPNAPITIAFPLGKIWKATMGGRGGYTIVAGTGNRAVQLKDAQGNLIDPPNWLESMNVTIAAFNDVGLSNDQITSLLHDVSNRMDQALLAYKGKDVQDLPDNVNVTIQPTEHPTNWEPFGTIIPGVTNPGVNGTTGGTPIDSTIGGLVAVANAVQSIGNLLGILISPAGLALIGGAILLFVGFKYLVGANQGDSAPSKPSIPIVPGV